MPHQHHSMHSHLFWHHVRPSQKVATFEVALLEKKHVAEGTVAFIFEKPDGLHVRAGQHVRLTLIDPPETDEEGTSRFFSLANSPQEVHLVIVMRMRDTAFKRVLARLPIGGKVRIQTLRSFPHGSFALHDDASAPAVFLAGGIGIVPAFSLIKDALERKLPRKLFLFYSNRRAQDAPFLDELETLAKHHPAFTLIATLTQPEPETEASSWRGETGHIDQAMLKRYVDDLASPIYYVAGLPDMVRSMRNLLTGAGVSEEHIRAEEFPGFSMGQHKMTHFNTVRMSPLLLVAIVAVISVVVILHVVAAIFIAKTAGAVSSLNNAIFYALIGLLVVLALFKLKYLLGFLCRKVKRSAREMSHGASSRSSVPHEQRQEPLP